MRFTDRVAIVTGAASGIGRATAQRLYDEGATIALVDRNEEALAVFAASLPDAQRVSWRSFDIGDEAEVERFVADVQNRHGHIDVLCNNAGIAGGDYSAISETDTAVWQRILQVNVMGAVNFTKHASRVMRNQKQGAIVNTASVAGVRSGAGGNAYSASKAAVINLTMTSACDLGQFNVRVNAVCPGLIETGMTAPVFERARAADKEDRLGSRCELRRYGRPQEVAAVIAFLASDDASYVTGQALPVDGGNTASLNLPGMKV
jgi:meso-butanediol dehydrogenase/(S,S)-butanediol dehydrogenase/diacetyl reductase